MLVKAMEELDWNQAHFPVPIGFSASPAATAAAWGDSTAGTKKLHSETEKSINKRGCK